MRAARQIPKTLNTKLGLRSGSWLSQEKFQIKGFKELVIRIKV